MTLSKKPFSNRMSPDIEPDVSSMTCSSWFTLRSIFASVCSGLLINLYIKVFCILARNYFVWLERLHIYLLRFILQKLISYFWFYSKSYYILLNSINTFIFNIQILSNCINFIYKFWLRFKGIKTNPFFVLCIFGCRIRIWNPLFAVRPSFWDIRETPPPPQKKKRG